MTLSEREAFKAYLKTKGIVKIDWNCLGVITNVVREAGCTLGYNDIELMQEVWEAKAQAVPKDCVIVPKELHIEIAMKMAKERIFKQSAGNDPVWNELVEQAYKDNLQAEQYRLIRDYREMVKASESGAEG